MRGNDRLAELLARPEIAAGVAKVMAMSDGGKWWIGNDPADPLDEEVGHFELMPAYGDGGAYQAKCLQPGCEWISQKTTRPADLMKVHGPVRQHHRDAHGYAD